MSNGYLIGPQFAENIKRTIARVDGMPVGGSKPARIPTFISGDEGGSGGGGLKLAAFTGTMAWVRMDQRTIYFVENDTASTSVLPIKLSTRTATAVASMFSIPGVTTTASMATALVTVAKIGGRWHAIAAAGGA